MLPPAHRLRRSTDFHRVLRQGRRATTALLVVHALETHTDEPGRVGFVVSKAVGSAPVRNRVKRRLRHLVHVRLGGWERGLLIVVRANPSAATATYADLGRALDRCMHRLDESAVAR